MPTLNLTKAEAFALQQMVTLEIGSGAVADGIAMGVVPKFDADKLRAKVNYICPFRWEIEHLFSEEGA
jgi:hypothetical protein